MRGERGQDGRTPRPTYYLDVNTQLPRAGCCNGLRPPADYHTNVVSTPSALLRGRDFGKMKCSRSALSLCGRTRALILGGGQSKEDRHFPIAIGIANACWVKDRQVPSACSRTSTNKARVIQAKRYSPGELHRRAPATPTHARSSTPLSVPRTRIEILRNWGGTLCHRSIRALQIRARASHQYPSSAGLGLRLRLSYSLALNNSSESPSALSLAVPESSDPSGSPIQGNPSRRRRRLPRIRPR